MELFKPNCVAKFTAQVAVWGGEEVAGRGVEVAWREVVASCGLARGGAARKPEKR
jgi:hypothetical protein